MLFSGSVGAQEQARAADPAFDVWLAELRKEALGLGITPATVEKALTGIELLPVVVERDRTQAELVQPLDKYLARRLNRKTIATGREMAERHKELLARVSAKYGVPPRFIVAVWGLESNFGKFTGREADDSGARHAGLRPAPGGVLPRRAVRCASHPGSRRHRPGRA